MNNDKKRQIAGFFELLIEVDAKVQRWNERLKVEPDGFCLDGTYNCKLCSYATTEAWYSSKGILCDECKRK